MVWVLNSTAQTGQLLRADWPKLASKLTVCKIWLFRHNLPRLISEAFVKSTERCSQCRSSTASVHPLLLQAPTDPDSPPHQWIHPFSWLDDQTTVTLLHLPPDVIFPTCFCPPLATILLGTWTAVSPPLSIFTHSLP